MLNCTRHRDNPFESPFSSSFPVSGELPLTVGVQEAGVMLLGLGNSFLTYICSWLFFAEYYLITCPTWLLCRGYVTRRDDLVTSRGIQRCSYVLSNWVEVNAEIKVRVVLCFYSIVIHRQIFVELGSRVDAKSPGSGIHNVGDAHSAQLCFVTSDVPGRRTVGYIRLLHYNVG